jgi:hypothetical protein
MINKPFLLFIVLFTSALIPRLMGISFHSLWYDEASTALMVWQNSYDTMLNALYSIEGTPPLFYLLEKLLVDSVGVMNEFTLRLIPMICGTLSCVLIFYIVKRISTIENAFLSFLLTVCSNFFMYLSNEARCYSLFGFLVLLNLFIIIKWWDTQKKIFVLFFIISLFCLTQVHYYAVFWVVSLCISGFLFLRSKINGKIVLSIFGVFCVSYSILLPLFLSQSSNEVGEVREALTSKWFEGIFYTPVKVLINAYLYKIYSISQLTPRDYVGIILSLLIVFFSLFLFIKKLKNKEFTELKQFVFISFIVGFFLHTLVGSLIPTIHPRYMSHFLILLFPFIVTQLSTYRFVKYSAVVLLLLFNFFAAFNYYGKNVYYIEPYREIVSTIRNYNADNSLSNQPVISNLMDAYSISFYFKDSSQLFYSVPSYKNLDSIFTPYKFLLFGNTYYTEYLKIHFFALTKPISFRQIASQYHSGFIILRPDNQQSDYLQEFSTEFKAVRHIKTFVTNQGKLLLLKWEF